MAEASTARGVARRADGVAHASDPRARCALSRRRPFVFDGERYSYLIHHHNPTWRNERTVENPDCGGRVLARRRGARLLEVGNVLHNYPRRVPPAARA